ncbi:NAD kinase [Flavobacteriaceae bacterium]|jgi:NAD+ kinase|nr:NAD kinase [Flavobacteriaceae bacterium]MDC0872653.1 NAD kinase [Flavobacteriaceae bacterium]
MHIAIYSAFFSPTSIAYIKTVIEYLNANDHQFILVDRLKKHLGEEGETYDYFKDDVALEKKVDFLFSVGGDGTLLRSIAVIRDSKIPILGINAGRLGFLTSIKKDTLQDGLDLFFQGKYSIVERSLLAVATKEPTEALQEFGFALNEVTINRKNTTSMLSIHTKLNDQFLTTYWSDGLIIATPTGSTGYSLSSGGPIVTPTSKCLVVNPIAPHNINMRPLIVPDDTAFEINVQGRGNTHLLSLDSRILTLENGNDIYIKKAEFSALTVQLDGTFFFNTLREKLFWGHDSRNVQ